MTQLPAWLTATVVLTCLGLLVYTVVVIGPDGYPIVVVLGGLLGAYAGIRELFNRSGSGGGK